MKNDENFIVKDKEITDQIIAEMINEDIFDNKLRREEILPGIICGFLDIYSMEIYMKCTVNKKASSEICRKTS